MKKIMFFPIFLLYSSFLLVFADDGTILVISKNKLCSSSYLLTSYVETAEGYPIGSTRCAKNSLSNSMLDDTTVADDGDCIDEFEDVIDFCQAAFVENNKTTHCLSTRNVSLPESNVSSVYSRDNACKTIRSIRTEYLNFEKVLDRTLVGVYTPTCHNKTICLNAYTRWLCSVELKWFAPSEENNSTNCFNETIETDSVTYVRILPCIGICHDVLRRCPYYLPSEQQGGEGSKVLIYGGYPAFDCPMQISSNTSAYAQFDSCCFGNSAVVSTVVDSFIMLLFVSLCFFII